MGEWKSALFVMFSTIYEVDCCIWLYVYKKHVIVKLQETHEYNKSALLL